MSVRGTARTHARVAAGIAEGAALHASARCPLEGRAACGLHTLPRSALRTADAAIIAVGKGLHNAIRQHDTTLSCVPCCCCCLSRKGSRVNATAPIRGRERSARRIRGLYGPILPTGTNDGSTGSRTRGLHACCRPEAASTSCTKLAWLRLTSWTAARRCEWLRWLRGRHERLHAGTDKPCTVARSAAARTASSRRRLHSLQRPAARLATTRASEL